MERKIKVIIKRPGGKPYSTYISNTPKNLQNTVGGRIEAATIASDCVLIFNEYGAINGMPFNCDMFNMKFYGTIIVAGVNGDGFCDIPLDFNAAKRILPPKFWEMNCND